ncbi:MAG: NAD(P)/FAD-dependent oxidoreductase, partial [Candidatus Diapherotrites archaeon]|nr:NAD(P)/FAD-dependent oxidoreductase [Candidatus Diapherotrites archaeon]
ECLNCQPCRIMCGVGGAGGMSDGKLNLHPYIGGNLTKFTNSEEDAYELINYVDNVLIGCGVTSETKANNGKINQLQELALKSGVKFIPVKQKHIGSDKLGAIITTFKNNLEEKGVKFLLHTTVEDLIIEDSTIKGVKTRNKEITATEVILAPGREGTKWFIDMAEKHNINKTHSTIDVGVRVETKKEITDKVTNINYDPKIHIFTNTYDDFVRTFCTNPGGFVVQEDYKVVVGVNGHSMAGKKSENTNFALLVRIQLTEPVENTYEYGKAIAQLATTIGGGKPILQRLRDLKMGKRSTWDRLKRSFVQPTLKQVTPGDISMALPQRIVTDILEAIEKLDTIMPGINSGNTLLYAPEIKYYSAKAEINPNMETNVTNLFAAGDGCGLSRDIINAASTGVLAARGIINKNKTGELK